MPKSGLTKTQRAYMGDTMDSVGRIFEFEQLSFEAFERCRTAGDIAEYLHPELARWAKLHTESHDDAYRACLESLRREMHWYLRKPLSLDDLDCSLVNVFARKRRRRPFNTIKVWFDALRSNFYGCVPILSHRPWVQPLFRRLGILYFVFLLMFVLTSTVQEIGWVRLPDWVTIVAGVILISPFIMIMALSSTSGKWLFKHLEPDLTVRQLFVWYADKLRSKVGTCTLDEVQSVLLEHWETEDGEPGTPNSPVPWLNK